MPFEFLKPPFLAIDIGSSSIKMVELTGKGASKTLKSFSVEDLPPGIVHDGVIQDVGPVQQCLHKMARGLNKKNRRVALSIGGSALVIKKVSIQIGKDIVLEEQIPFHAEQAFQLDPSTLYYDWAELPDRGNQTDAKDVLLVGARREIVEQYVACIREAGMRVGVIECSAFSAANIFEHNYGVIDGLVAVISIGASHTQISFILDGVFQFSRDIPIGGETYTRKIMDAMAQPYEGAEALKLAPSMNAAVATPEMTRIFTEVNELLVQDLNSTLTYFLQSSDTPQGAFLKYVFLSGGAARTPGLDTSIAAGLQAPVFPLNPFQRISVNDRKFPLEHMLSVSPVLGVAAGLALRTPRDKA